MEKNIKKLFEIIIAYLILFGLNILFCKTDIGFNDFRLNPIWIIILLFSSKYGVGFGFTSAIIGSFYYLHINISDFFLNLFYIPDYEKINYIISFIIISIVIGEIGTSFNKKIKRLNDKIRDLKKDNKRVTIHNDSLISVNEELEKRIVGNVSTIPALYRLAKKLEKLSIEELYPSVLDIISEFIEAEKISFYVLEGDMFILKTQKGWDDDKELNSMESLDDSIMGEVVKQDRLVSVLDLREYKNITLEKRKHETYSRIASSPIKLESGKIIGVVNIDKIDFHKFNSYSLKLFKTITEWVSLAFSNAYSYIEADDMRIEDYKTKLYSYNYLARALEREFLCAKKYNFSLSFFIIELEDYFKIKNKENVLVLFAMTLYMVLRTTDVIGRYKNKGSFAVMLPFLNKEDIDSIKNRLMESFKKFDIKPYEHNDSKLKIKIGTGSLKPEHESYEDLMGDVESVVSDQ